MLKTVHTSMRKHGIESWGVCRYEDALPLIGCQAILRLPPHAKSIILALFPYHIGDWPERNVARYAVVDDYHTVAARILGAIAADLHKDSLEDEYAIFVDNSPIREVTAAQLAGLGRVGMNNMLINPRYGAYAMIGEIVTTMDVPTTEVSGEKCLCCGACVQACPTGAIRRGEPLDRPKCRSWITQKKGELSAWERAQVRAGGMAWGCDLCLDACPINIIHKSPIKPFYEGAVPRIETATLDDYRKRKAYGYRSKAVLERNLKIIDNEQE